MSPIAQATNKRELKGKFTADFTKLSHQETNNNEHGIRGNGDSYLSSTADQFHSIASQMVIIIINYIS